MPNGAAQTSALKHEKARLEHVLDCSLSLDLAGFGLDYLL